MEILVHKDFPVRLVRTELTVSTELTVLLVLMVAMVLTERREKSELSVPPVLLVRLARTVTPVRMANLETRVFPDNSKTVTKESPAQTDPTEVPEYQARRALRVTLASPELTGSQDNPELPEARAGLENQDPRDLKVQLETRVLSAIRVNPETMEHLAWTVHPETREWMDHRVNPVTQSPEQMETRDQMDPKEMWVIPAILAHPE